MEGCNINALILVHLMVGCLALFLPGGSGVLLGSRVELNFESF